MSKLKKYVWFFEFFASAILIAFAITSVIKQEFVVFAFGSVFVIFGLFRIVPLVKTTESKLIKYLTIAELVIDVVCGVILFAFSDKFVENDTKLFGYIVGGVMYLRGFMHFLSTSVKKEPTTFMAFIVNIAFITLASGIIFNGGFSVKYLAWFFLAMVCLCVIIFVLRGMKDYRSYRGNLVGESKTKNVKVVEQKEEEVTNPTSDEIKINIVPEKEEQDQEVAQL